MKLKCFQMKVLRAQQSCEESETLNGHFYNAGETPSFELVSFLLAAGN